MMLKFKYIESKCHCMGLRKQVLSLQPIFMTKHSLWVSYRYTREAIHRATNYASFGLLPYSQGN